MKTFLAVALATFKRPAAGLLASLPLAKYVPGETIETEDPDALDALLAAKLAAVPSIPGPAANAVGRFTEDGSDFAFEYRAHDGETVVRRGGETTWRVVGEDGHVGGLRSLPDAEPTAVPTGIVPASPDAAPVSVSAGIDGEPNPTPTKPKAAGEPDETAAG